MTNNLQNQYRDLFAWLGYPLSKRDGLLDAEIEKAEVRLGIKLPASLRDYYLVAGREKIFNHVFNRLSAPNEWEIHARKLIFMKENQTVVVWGVPVSNTRTADPLVFQCPLVSGELGKWYSERIHCSGFLQFMIHLQAAYGGGMPFTASARAPSDLSPKLKRTWRFGGEVNGMRAYSREHQAICVTKWQDFGERRKTWRVFAGARSMADLTALGRTLGVEWDR